MDFTYCPRCGHALEKRHIFGRMRSVCPACKFIHFADPKVASASFVERVHDGIRQVLLIQRGGDPGRGDWALPGGFVEQGEPPDLTAARETSEETGIEIEVKGLLGVTFGGLVVVLTYAARPVGGTLAAGDDAADARWFSAETLPENLVFENTQHLTALWKQSDVLFYLTGLGTSESGEV